MKTGLRSVLGLLLVPQRRDQQEAAVDRVRGAGHERRVVLQSHAIRDATSRASPGRPAGTPGRSTLRGFTSSLSVMGVAISPGATELTVIPCSPSSSAS